MFPVGAMTKPEVRAYAERRGLLVAGKPDSHEICFVPDGDTAGFVSRRLPEVRDGDIEDSSGRVVGHHAGVHHFTVGQRKGLGLSTGVPLYVLKVDADHAPVVVGSKDELGGRALEASGVNWISGDAPDGEIRVTTRIRHRHRDAPATLVSMGSARARVTFDEPQIAIAPGQAAVFYDGDRVIGGGWID